MCSLLIVSDSVVVILAIEKETSVEAMNGYACTFNLTFYVLHSWIPSSTSPSSASYCYYYDCCYYISLFIYHYNFFSSSFLSMTSVMVASRCITHSKYEPTVNIASLARYNSREDKESAKKERERKAKKTARGRRKLRRKRRRNG